MKGPKGQSSAWYLLEQCQASFLLLPLFASSSVKAEDCFPNCICWVALQLSTQDIRNMRLPAAAFVCDLLLRHA